MKITCNCPGSPFAGVNSTCTGRKTMDFQHLNGALAYHYRAKRAYFGQYRDGFSISLAIDLSSKGLPGQLPDTSITVASSVSGGLFWLRLGGIGARRTMR